MSVMSDIIQDYMYQPDDSIGREILVQELQKQCPGNYTVVFIDSPTFTVSIRFSDSEEATMFRIKGWM